MRHPKPWLRKGKGYFVQINRKQYSLGKDKAEAYRAFYALMSSGSEKLTFLGEIVDEFVQWVKLHRAPDTHRWYKDRLDSFKEFYPRIAVEELRPFHIQRWIDNYKVSSTTKRNLARSIQRAMRWAVEQGYIDRSPIEHFKKPPAGVRETVISPEEYKKILANAGVLKSVIEFAWNTGSRASEILKIDRSHLQGNRIILPRSDEKMKRAPRIIYLNARALAIAQRVSEGRIFRNSDGKPWTADAINCGFGRIKKATGITCSLTALRHTWCHRMLKAGTDSLTVATLMGHSGTSMIAKVYGHLNHATQHLSDAVEKAG